ncbi:Endoribonuclease L-PSP/chorismate mutase-like protein [Bisporella sp. PMI_857]|nr:Endoribonuclease L-PSP/chorismate mutase-like protein [Bisporella sp. PMI_857]
MLKSNRMSRAFVTRVAQPLKRWVTVNPKAELESSTSAAFVSGEWVFVSACNGYNPQTKTISPLIEEQAEQIFINIETALREGGATMKDIVRIRYILKDASEWRDCRRVLRKWLGSVRPASSVMQAVLLDDTVRIEIEVTARKTGERHEYAD